MNEPVSETPEEKRRKRLHELAGRLKDDGSSSYKAILGWCMLRWGSKRETVVDYLETLRFAGLVSFTKEEIHWIGPDS